MLNLAGSTLTDTFNTIDLGEQEVFMLTVAASTTQKMKSGKAAGKYETRPEMLKILNEEG